MSVLDKLAGSMGIKSDVPNQQLAKELAENTQIEEIKIIAENLGNTDKAVQSDCIKVLYEIG